MALNQARTWLIGYDICDPRRLKRVHRFMCARAVPVQYSVFATRSTPMEIGILLAELAEIVRKGEDDVRAYPVPEPAYLSVLGSKALPDGLRVLQGDSALMLAPFESEGPGMRS